MKTKLVSLLLALAAALFTGGCETVGEPFAQRFSQPAVHRVIEAKPERAFAAAVASLRGMGYTIRRAKAKDGVIEAYGRLGIDDSFRSSNQHNCTAATTETPDGAADVRFEVREQVEERTGAGLMRQSEQTLPFGGIHQHFYDELQRRLL